MQAPRAQRIEKKLKKHGDLRIDAYYWMNDRNSKEVRAYLEQENVYCDEQMSSTQELQNELYEEMKKRYKKDDESVPYLFNGYWYIVHYFEGKEHPVFVRKKGSLEAESETIVDVNLLAQGYDFFEIGSVAVSPGNELVSYAWDTAGDRSYSISIKNLRTGEVLKDELKNTTGKLVWAEDNTHVFYVRLDEQLRASRVYRHKIGTDPSQDVLVFFEKDEAFDVHVQKSKSQEYILLGISSTLSDECWFLKSDEPLESWTLIQPREEGLEYCVEPYKEEWILLTNEGGATNFKLMKTSLSTPTKEHWQELLPYDSYSLLEGFEVFENYLVVEERRGGLLSIRIVDRRTNESHFLPFEDPTYTAYIGLNLDFDTDQLQYGYSSLTHPSRVCNYDMAQRKSIVLKENQIMDPEFKIENYTSDRLWVKARDGKKIPVSLVHHKNTALSPETPLLLYGYGSYGSTVDAHFSSVRLSLLDRGFVYAIAHVRGGEYLGREWYLDGKMLQKKNTFYDFIDVSKELIAREMTSSRHLYAMGGSAGGLLMGVIMNLEPTLYHGVVAEVPFVDVVTTMLDASIPLTTGEYDEWGNPNEKEYYDYMKSYSPYDNVRDLPYPNLLVTTGFNDSQVQYWEPAKWVAKLREHSQSKNLILLKTDMDSGHGGAAGRFESLKEEALEFAFLLKLEQTT